MRGSLGPLPVKVLVAVGGTIVAAALIAAAFLFRPAAATQTPAAWPAPDARALLARAGRVWRALHSLSFREQLASDTRHETRSTWQIQAPNRVAYQVKGGWSGIIVGARRWDRTPQGGGWVESP